MAGSSPTMTKDSRARKAMLTEAADYDTLYRNFRWDIPDALQHRDCVLRPPCRRQRPAGADLCRRGRRGDADLVRRGQRVVAPLCQCAEGGRPRARRPRRGVSVAVAGIADRASGGVSIRHGVDPAVRAVRRGRAGISPFEFRRQGHRHRRGRLGEAGKNPRPPAGPEKHLCDRRSRAGRHQVVLVGAEGGIRRISRPSIPRPTIPR